LEHKDEATMKRMLLYDFFRGPDSTGFAAVRHANGDSKIAKIASHPLDLFDMKRFTDALNAYSSMAFIGHNRAATKGVVNNLNAHPYEFGEIVGAHNGTLDNKSWKALEESLGESFGVDSMAVIAHIAKFGIDATIPLMQGAWSLVWYDKTDKTLNFIRNKERPMWFGYSKDGRKLFWASEWPMIQAAAKLSPALYEWHISDKGFTYFETEEDTLYTFNLEELRSIDGGIPDGKRHVIKGKEPAPVVQQHQYGHFPFTGTAAVGSRTSSTTTFHGSTKGGTSNNGIVHFLAQRGDPFAGQLSRERFEEIAQYGCSYCSASIAYEDVGVTVVDRDDIILCPSCSTDNTVNRVILEDIPELHVGAF
jgi:hypothetical protein